MTDLPGPQEHALRVASRHHAAYPHLTTPEREADIVTEIQLAMSERDAWWAARIAELEAKLAALNAVDASEAKAQALRGQTGPIPFAFPKLREQARQIANNWRAPWSKLELPDREWLEECIYGALAASEARLETYRRTMAEAGKR